jgi:hypothetical protein
MGWTEGDPNDGSPGEGEPRARKPDDIEEFRVVNALREAIHTRRHAQMLFDMVADHLGAAAWLETLNGQTTRTLFRREAPGSPWILPWPLLTLTLVGTDDPRSPVRIVPLNYDPADTPQRPVKPSNLRGMGPGSVTIHDGPEHITVSYAKEGRWFECSRSASKDALAGVLPALAAGGAPAAEIVAAWAAGLDLARHGPGRVHLPQAVPGGIRGAWNCGLFAIREALFRERVPRAARWVAADGWTGAAVAWGPTREAAVEAWRAEVARVRPFPEKPKPPADPPPQIQLRKVEPDNPFEPKPLFGHHDQEVFSIGGTIHGPKSDVEWVEPTLETTPAVLIPLGDLPAIQPALGAWTWLVGARGAPVPAALRLEDGGFTLVGDRLLEVLDLGSLEKRLAAANREAGPRPEYPPGFPCPRVETDSHLRTYRLVDERTGKPVEARVVQQGWSLGYRPITLDGDQLRWSLVRLETEKG